MRRKLFLIWNLILSGCAIAPAAPPREETCILRAPSTLAPADPGALECFDPVTNLGATLPFSAADKFICQPPAARKEYDLYLKLRGI